MMKLVFRNFFENITKVEKKFKKHCSINKLSGTRITRSLLAVHSLINEVVRENEATQMDCLCNCYFDISVHVPKFSKYES